jgi:hypothetical protein
MLTVGWIIAYVAIFVALYFVILVAVRNKKRKSRGRRNVD